MTFVMHPEGDIDLWCDEYGCLATLHTAPMESTLPAFTKSERARKAAAEEGWTHDTYLSVDLCPEHARTTDEVDWAIQAILMRDQEDTSDEPRE